MSRIARLLCTADEAVARIPDGVTLTTGGFVGAAHPEALTAALERRFLATGTPKNLTLIYGAGQGDGQNRGLNHLGHAGLLKRVIGGHWGLIPKIGRLVLDNQVEGYNFPQGVIYQLIRDTAAGRPGSISHVGLGTFIDPEKDGGRLNSITTERLVERIELEGRTWLFYKTFPIHVGLIRATAADPFGNLCMDQEAVIGDVLSMSQAARNSKGLVIAQVKRLLDDPLPPGQVRVPGILVNHIVVADAADHPQTFAEADNPLYYQSSPASSIVAIGLMPLDERRIIAARACDELAPGSIANLGIGMPEGVASIAAERALLESVTLTLESGPIGGVPAGGLSFGASVHPEAIIDQSAMFDFYDGGGLDFSALGAAQIDEQGNVNVSKFGTRIAGVGGFVNISQNARRLVFCTTFTSGGLVVAVRDSRLVIEQEGTHRKFVQHLDQVSYSGEIARRLGRDVLFVTERAVFCLRPEGLELVEVAPGIDLETQIIAQMEFRPLIRRVRPMSEHLFRC